jgi:hypothetical protein
LYWCFTIDRFLKCHKLPFSRATRKIILLRYQVKKVKPRYPYIFQPWKNRQVPLCHLFFRIFNGSGF